MIIINFHLTPTASSAFIIALIAIGMAAMVLTGDTPVETVPLIRHAIA